MGAGGEYVVIEVTGEGLCVLAASVGLGRIDIHGVHSALCPADLPRSDAAAVGGWVRDELTRAGLVRGRAVVVIPRGDVVLKTMVLPRPTGSTARTGDMAGMVRLQMQRQLTMSAEGAAVDYVEVGKTATADGVEQVEVLAGALTGERLAWWREMGEAAGLRVGRIVPRCMAVGAMIAEVSERREGAVVGVGIGAHETDLVVAEGGRLVLARSVEVPSPPGGGEDATFADRMVVEVKRTWTSRQGGKSGVSLEGCVIVGGGRLRESVAAKVGAALGVRGEVVYAPPTVVWPEAGGAGPSRGEVEVLVGVLLETIREQESLNFIHPRRVPDSGAKRRQLTLAGAMAAIVLGGVGYIGADMSLGGLREELAKVTAREKQLQGDVDEFLRAHARLAHLERWRSARVDWVQHLGALSDGMPDPSQATLDELSARGAGEVTFTPKNAYPGGTWGERRGATFELSGKAEARQVASDWRDALLATGLYDVQTRGADTPNRFSFSLVTSAASPKPAAKDGPGKPPPERTNGGAP